jgi:Omp85 superfamily domain
MKRLFLGFFPVWIAIAQAQDSSLPQVQLPQVQSIAMAEEGHLNVNERYRVESTQVIGWRVQKMSDTLRARIDRLTGAKFDSEQLEPLATEIKRELHVPKVNVIVARGSAPASVVVTFEVPRSHEQDFELNVARFLYHSKQGWTGEGSATTHLGDNAISFGLVSDGDALLERFAGVRAGIERPHVFTDRLALRFDFASYHNQWNQSTLTQSDTLAQSSDETYRTRQVFEPQARLLLTPSLELDFGVRISRYRLAAPGVKTESSNAVVSTLRYHRRWGSDPADDQEVNASYNVTSATRVLESDPLYTRQTVNGAYKARRGKASLELAFLAGKIAGVAPLFDRFVLGNATTLRGWNKFVLDPLGGSRVIHGSITCAYRWLQGFYDSGAVWDQPQQRQKKQSAGAGFKAEKFQLAVAFPLQMGHVDPVFYAGMNF